MAWVRGPGAVPATVLDLRCCEDGTCRPIPGCRTGRGAQPRLDPDARRHAARRPDLDAGLGERRASGPGAVRAHPLPDARPDGAPGRGPPRGVRGERLRVRPHRHPGQRRLRGARSPTSTPRRSSGRRRLSSRGSRRSPGAQGGSGCWATAGAASMPSRSRRSGRPRSLRSSPPAPPTTGSRTTCTTWAARC